MIDEPASSGHSSLSGSHSHAGTSEHASMHMGASMPSDMPSPDGSGGKNHSHHDHHAGMLADFRKRFWVCLALTLPVLLLSGMTRQLLHIRLHIPAGSYLLLALSSVIYFWGGRPFLAGLREELRQKNPGMMTLIGLAISVAYLYSAATVLGLRGPDFFWELATLIDIMLLGHWVEMRSVMGASRALELLAGLMPREAHRLTAAGVPEDIPLDQVKSGDLLVVKPGEKLPADGTVTEGSSYLDESLLTGESRPLLREAGSRVIGGSLNGRGSLTIRVEHSGQDSYLRQVVRLVEQAQQAKSSMQTLSDKAARWLTLIAIGAGLGTFALWLAAGKSLAFALERMATVMVITCPHALGLAVPLVVAISTAVSARNGLLVRNRTAFEASRNISALLFDKTGTLTTGVFGVSRFHSTLPGWDDAALLAAAAAVEQHSEHPIAQGIVTKARRLGYPPGEATEFQARPGSGVSARVQGRLIEVLSPGALNQRNLPLPQGASGSEAETLVYVLCDGLPAGYIALSDALRPESRQAVGTLQRLGIRVYMATGDNRRVAEAVSRELSLDGVYAEVLPGRKADIVKELQTGGAFVAMAGDGVNDAPALAQANVGIAVGSGTDIAQETADIILVNSNPMDLVKLIRFAKATHRKMIQNLVWATGYNALAIPLAAGLWYRQGLVLSPAAGAVLMSLSTVIVALNAQLLRRQMKG